ncbi:MAG: signal peptidase II [Candidatus Marinimicrobia bacterium]|nr:signal peptidase II [Candidatus Neomarinimicrobiota bacterium]MCH8068179.1 signal peptidase II [Candidatus Neomarinimicrobiota bacterium]
MTVLVYTIFVVILDQVTKQIARTSMTFHDSIPVIRNFFHFTYVENSGIAFGINFPGGSVIFPIASIIATVAVFYYLWLVRKDQIVVRLSLALILGGAIGNLIDRLLFGKVVDFFDFSIAGYHWPVFNVSDSSVTIGLILFLYSSFIVKNTLKTVNNENN